MDIYFSRGFKFMKIGEDATLDLQTFSLSGKKNKIMRRTFNNSSQYKLEFYKPPHNNEFLDKLEKVSDN